MTANKSGNQWNQSQLKESSLIVSILETHFTTGKPLSDVLTLYPAVNMGIEDTNTGKWYEYFN